MPIQIMQTPFPSSPSLCVDSLYPLSTSSTLFPVRSNLFKLVHNLTTYFTDSSSCSDYLLIPSLVHVEYNCNHVLVQWLKKSGTLIFVSSHSHSPLQAVQIKSLTVVTMTTAIIVVIASSNPLHPCYHHASKVQWSQKHKPC